MEYLATSAFALLVIFANGVRRSSVIACGVFCMAVTNDVSLTQVMYVFRLARYWEKTWLNRGPFGVFFNETKKLWNEAFSWAVTFLISSRALFIMLITLASCLATYDKLAFWAESIRWFASLMQFWTSAATSTVWSAEANAKVAAITSIKNFILPCCCRG